MDHYEATENLILWLKLLGKSSLMRALAPSAVISDLYECLHSHCPTGTHILAGLRDFVLDGHTDKSHSNIFNTKTSAYQGYTKRVLLFCLPIVDRARWAVMRQFIWNQKIWYLAEIGVKIHHTVAELLHILCQELVRIGDPVIQVSHFIVGEASEEHRMRTQSQRKTKTHFYF